jgi:hypothetical protein
MYLDKGKKDCCRGEFNIFTGGRRKFFNSRSEKFLLAISAWIHFVKGREKGSSFHLKTKWLTHAKDLNDAQEIINLVTQDSKDIVAKIRKKILKKLNFMRIF